MTTLPKLSKPLSMPIAKFDGSRIIHHADYQPLTKGQTGGLNKRVQDAVEGRTEEEQEA